MEFSNIDFKYTNQIKRLINEMLDYWNVRRQQGATPDKIKYLDPLKTDFFTDYENKDISEYTNTIKFLMWLRNNNAIEHGGDMDEGRLAIFDDPEEYYDYPKVMEIKIRDNKPIERLRCYFLGQSPEVKVIENHYFFIDDNRDFSYGEENKRNAIKFKNKGTIYYKVFRALYELDGGNNRIVTHTEINNKLLEFGEKDKDTESKRISRIKTAILHLKNNIAKEIGLPLKIKGREVITVKRGEGYKFYNPLNGLY